MPRYRVWPSNRRPGSQVAEPGQGRIDAALIAAAQRVEHYEMAGYGCVRTFANLLGYTSAAKLLQETLDEEGGADKKLTELAETVIDIEAGEDEESEEEPAPKSKAKKSPAKK
ncbi:Uncharacterized protein OS=Pirellula staleyi (strain ATCC 27377 / DSM 6068 / ICPB 4128) GN=Psta_0826 PE=4 SV=1: DUF892 [Gemmata massiliana]|uniref:Uncharacterized protein n=1 Tax=Gemmata massiliana TaxID=1210884 RepID=A0A6P2CXI0_9BACT|nr:DUF892 family protein [Gemmata massiliana]VTR92865.1 Uncharacterized protein OS=Pirellula staleyi (strain ATCC 27377 / DSM 6068 / ICPB 4128) GN=Psta_0826 PE=4 SV=1: DUF892 [Gemmata massiliana]